MIRRTLASRLERLEGRLGIGSERPTFCLKFVDTDRKVVSTLTLRPDGQREWRYAPGHGPDDESGQSILGNGTAIGLEKCRSFEEHRTEPE
jgi:hypothetical protein